MLGDHVNIHSLFRPSTSATIHPFGSREYVAPREGAIDIELCVRTLLPAINLDKAELNTERTVAGQEAVRLLDRALVERTAKQGAQGAASFGWGRPLVVARAKVITFDKDPPRRRRGCGRRKWWT